MSRRTPGRLLAPLALAAVVIALFVVLGGGGAGTEDAVAPARSPGATTSRSASGAKKGARAKRRARGRSTYTIKAGDTPSGIAEKTGVGVDQLLELNPELDPQSLSPGTKLKLK